MYTRKAESLSLPASGSACPSPPPPAKQHVRQTRKCESCENNYIVADPRVGGHVDAIGRERKQLSQTTNIFPESSHFALYDGDLEIS